MNPYSSSSSSLSSSVSKRDAHLGCNPGLPTPTPVSTPALAMLIPTIPAPIAIPATPLRTCTPTPPAVRLNIPPDNIPIPPDTIPIPPDTILPPIPPDNRLAPTPPDNRLAPTPPDNRFTPTPPSPTDPPFVRPAPGLVEFRLRAGPEATDLPSPGDVKPRVRERPDEGNPLGKRGMGLGILRGGPCLGESPIYEGTLINYGVDVEEAGVIPDKCCVLMGQVPSHYGSSGSWRKKFDASSDEVRSEASAGELGYPSVGVGSGGKK